MKRRTKEAIIVIWVGIIFFLIGFYMISSNNTFIKDAIPIETQVSNIHRTNSNSNKYAIYVDYVFEGEKYNDIRLVNYNHNVTKGEIIEAYINPNKPTDCRYPQKSLLFYLFKIVGFLVAIIGFKDLSKCLYNNRLLRILKKNGNKKYLIITNVEQQFNKFTNNPTGLYAIYCEDIDHEFGFKREIKSKNIYQHINESFTGKKVAVYFNPINNDEYIIDIDDIQSENKDVNDKAVKSVNTKTQKKRANLKFIYCLIFIITVFIFMSKDILKNEIDFYLNADKVEAEVISTVETYDTITPTVKYKYKEQLYEVNLPGQNSLLKEGQIITLHIDPTNPEDCRHLGSILSVIAILGFSIIMMFIFSKLFSKK